MSDGVSEWGESVADWYSLHQYIVSLKKSNKQKHHQSNARHYTHVSIFRNTCARYRLLPHFFFVRWIVEHSFLEATRPSLTSVCENLMHNVYHPSTHRAHTHHERARAHTHTGIQVGDEVSLHSLKSEQYNGLNGIVMSALSFEGVCVCKQVCVCVCVCVRVCVCACARGLIVLHTMSPKHRPSPGRGRQEDRKWHALRFSADKARQSQGHTNRLRTQTIAEPGEGLAAP